MRGFSPQKSRPVWTTPDPKRRLFSLSTLDQSHVKKGWSQSLAVSRCNLMTSQRATPRSASSKLQHKKEKKEKKSTREPSLRRKKLSVRDGASRGLPLSPPEGGGAGSVCFITTRPLFRTFVYKKNKPTLAESSRRATKNKSGGAMSSAPAHHSHSKSAAKL